MNRHLHRCIRAIAWTIAVFAISFPSASASWTRPNILFISLDIVRADFLTFRDSEAAPHMTELARDGVIFTQAVSGTSWTLPAHVQMFTGTPPVLHRVQSEDVRIDPRMPTLPEVLKQAGCQRAGVFTVSFLSGVYGFDRGFDVYHAPSIADDRESRPQGVATQDRKARAQSPEALYAPFVTSHRVVASARRALERADPAAPSFCSPTSSIPTMTSFHPPPGT